jgi:hypothetical protein
LLRCIVPILLIKTLRLMENQLPSAISNGV